ncbi:MAG: hypothetical protein U0P46_10405 [Holophagaceae bacterium]
MPSPTALQLDPDHLRFMAGGVSINTGSSGPDGRPSQCRAFGCRVEGAGRRIRIFLSAPHAVDLLRDVRRSGALAVVFSDPPTHRTIQLKGRDARVEPLAPDDPAVVAAYRAAFVACLGPLGFPEPVVRALLDCPDSDLVAVAFTPEAAFNQTPGAQAGAPLGAGS